MTDYAFGIDISRYDSANSLMDFEVAAKYEPFIRFIAVREGISWAYKDPFFDYHWNEIPKMDELRGGGKPVGRLAHHVLYPGENVEAQVDNLFKNIGNQADWTHDRLVIDAELDHNQSKARITTALVDFGALCEKETGRLPIIYSRRNWLLTYTNANELFQFDLWLAQYRWPLPFPLYTPEYEPPPQTEGLHGWLIHQTGDKGHGDLFGVAGKHYVDLNRWNGDDKAVAEYFGYDVVQPPPPPPPLTLEERVTDLERRVTDLESA
jgi:GH25 family lysozyme M1 (1,4-beta-N-acetylmuramidase)